MPTTLYQALLHYFTGVSKVFRNGTVSFSLDENYVAVFYHVEGVRHAFSQNIPITTMRETYYAVQNFCMDCYISNERDGKPLSSPELGLLAGMSNNHMRVMIHEIYKKLQRYGTDKLQ